MPYSKTGGELIQVECPTEIKLLACFVLYTIYKKLLLLLLFLHLYRTIDP